MNRRKLVRIPISRIFLFSWGMVLEDGERYSQPKGGSGEKWYKWESVQENMGTWFSSLHSNYHGGYYGGSVPWRKYTEAKAIKLIHGAAIAKNHTLLLVKEAVATYLSGSICQSNSGLCHKKAKKYVYIHCFMLKVLQMLDCNSHNLLLLDMF